MTESCSPPVPYCPVWAPDDQPDFLTNHPFARRAGGDPGATWRCVGVAYLERPGDDWLVTAFRLALRHRAAPGPHALIGGEFVPRERVADVLSMAS
jgi:hypothetical protein